MNDRLARVCATFFYIGHIPPAPGTLASAVALAVVYAVHHHLGLYLALGIAVTAVGFLTAGPVEKQVGRKDPGCIVIDEVAGMFISFLLIPMTVPVMITGFFLFRAFDMFKIYPCNRLEAMGGAAGIMLDDIVAGVYTNLVLQVAVRAIGLM